MKIFKNKIVIAIICFVLAALIAFIIIPKQKKNGDMVEVVRTVGTVPVNTYITENMLKTVEVPAAVLSDNVIKDKDSVVGKYSTTVIYSEDNIIGEKLSTEPTDSGLYALQDGEYAISVAVSDLSKGFSGKLLEGDVVSVYGFNDNTKTMEEYDDLKYVQVLAVNNSKGKDLEQAKQESTGSSDDIIPATVTLKVNENQAKELVYITNAGKVHIVFAGRGANGESLLNK